MYGKHMYGIHTHSYDSRMYSHACDRNSLKVLSMTLLNVLDTAVVPVIFTRVAITLE